MENVTFKTQKAAREAGLQTAKEWLTEERLAGAGGPRKSKIPCRNAKPTRVKGREFFSVEQCEEVVTPQEAKRRKLCIRREAESVRQFHGRYEDYPGYRISDCVPIDQRAGCEIRDAHLGAKDLKARGWSESLIKRFLGKPDETSVNPHCISGPPIRLYDLQRVEAVEKGPEFQAAVGRVAKHQETAQRAVETKRKRIMQKISEVQIAVPTISRNELTRKACQHYNGRNIDRPDSLRASPRADPEFLARICVNYLRHALTRYDELCDEIKGRVGKSEARTLLKERILDAIAETYPWLEDECEDQKRKLFEEEFDRDVRN